MKVEKIDHIHARVQNLDGAIKLFPDIKEAIAEMKSRGINMVGPVHEQGAVKQAWFDPAGTFGIQIELCEYPGDDIRAAAGDMQQWR